MPCYRNPGIEITRGTITKTRLSADVVIGYPDPVPAGRFSQFYVKTDWRGEPGERNVVLRFRSQTAQSGRILFNGEGAAGSETRVISGNMELLVAVYGQQASQGQVPDVLLEVVIDDETRGESLALSVRQAVAPPADALQILRRELGIALRGTRPETAPEQPVWDRYNGIFDDARDSADLLAAQPIGSASVPLVDGNLFGHTFDFQDIAKHLKSHRDPEGLANAKAIGKNNVFDLFQGHWRGNWRQRNECNGTVNECQDHEWQEAQRIEAGGKVYAQNGVFGPDSRAAIAPAEGAQPLSCLTLNTARDFGTDVLSIIDTENGIILGARGLKAQPDESGIQAQHPCVGFYVDHGKLLRVLEEAREGDLITYGVFLDINPGAEADPIDNQRTTVAGFQFQWNRATRQITGTPETKAGQYRKILTEPERQLEDHFRNRRLQPEHLQNMLHRRRLEFLTPEVVQAFLDNPANGAHGPYLERLKAFVREQDALRRAPLGERESATYIMGAGDAFYDSAAAYFELNPTAHVTILDGQSLRDVRSHLNANPPVKGPWGEVNVVSHANEWGSMAIPVIPGGDSVSEDSLRDARDSGDLNPLSDALFDVRTDFNIRGCDVGKDQRFLTSMSKALGETDDDDLQRPRVFAPRFTQLYTASRTDAGVVDFADQALSESWYVVYPENVQKTLNQKVQLFTSRHGNVVDWNDGLSRLHARFNGDLYHHVMEGDEAVELTWTAGSPDAASMPDLSTAQARQQWLDNEQGLQHWVSDLGLQMGDLQWTIVNDAGTLITTATGKGILVSVQRDFTAELREIFRIDGRFRTELDQRMLSADIREAFEQNDRELGRKSSALIQWTGNKWLITDPDRPQTYALRRDAGQIVVQTEGDRAQLPEAAFHIATSQAIHNALNSAIIPDGLRQQMQSHNIPVPLNFTIIRRAPNERWFLNDNDRATTYALSKVGGQLYIYPQPHLAHPPVTMDRFYGSEIPARPAESDLGENIVP
jgi:hypothetical protein